MKKRELVELKNSLRRRGFWVDIIKGELVLDSWYSRSNYYEMVSLLSSLGVSWESGNKGIRVNTNSSISDEVLFKIEIASRDNFRRPTHEVQLPRLFQASSRNDISISELDYGIASLVFSLNKVGIDTSMSCDGHGREDAKIWLTGNQIELVEDLINSARREVSFAFDWEVVKKSRSLILTGKKRITSDNWDVSKVQDDSLAFSQYLTKTYSPIIG
ncbi:hypothetical protein HXA31_00025 [Salipaludibacillus agaradhaerens]|jgi:hypothetical protein|uniref:Uncharacterized protein n=1 Tax=Salipaludibacillus agaradhaerens TaxID=76935 RepID=A0A9Q4B4B3_SALAG|nr:hypothetical protein [Salipaludibacillus agaradhaerens]MCR6097767.1 hypothetical protein [Salipaludibacillus agaradhaerens]MCR6112749.1 hypothetical protein [Salipaludibacillus agaradhaerens]